MRFSRLERNKRINFQEKMWGMETSWKGEMFGKFPNAISFFTSLGLPLPLLCSLGCNYLEMETYFSKQYDRVFIFITLYFMYHKFYHFKLYNSVVLSIFTICAIITTKFKNNSIMPKRKPVPNLQPVPNSPVPIPW